MEIPRAAGIILAVGAAIVLIAALALASSALSPGATAAPHETAGPIALPSPMAHGAMSLEEALAARRSVRAFSSEALIDAEISQLLWAAQGVTGPDGRRTAPSAGATYPLELLVVTAGGVHRYLPAAHALRLVHSADVRAELARSAADQDFIGQAPLVVVVAAVPSRTEARYGARAERYVTLEAGHAAQNLLLEAVALGLGAVPVGAFDDAAVARIVGLGEGERALYLVPVGHPK